MAKFLGDSLDEKKHTVQVEILQVLKGDLKPGKHHISYEDRPHIGSKDEEFIAFLDKDGVWRFMASPMKDQEKLAQDILQISGFYDFNAYWVTPGLVTLNQLKTYLKDRSLVYRFRGEICFPEPGKTDWKAGSIVIPGTYDVTNKEVDVKGFPNQKGFPTQPEVHIHSQDDESNFDLDYARFLNRPLNLIGKVQGLDPKTDAMRIRFAVSSPEVLTQKALEDYLGDASLGNCYYKFKLACAPVKDSNIPKILFLKWTENQWDGTQLEGHGKAPLIVFRTSFNGPGHNSGSISTGSPANLPKTMTEEGSKEDWVLRMSVKTDTEDYLTLGFQIGEPKRDEESFSWFAKNELLYALYRNQVKGTITLHDGQTARTVATFTTPLDSVAFNRYEKKNQ